MASQAPSGTLPSACAPHSLDECQGWHLVKTLAPRRQRAWGLALLLVLLCAIGAVFPGAPFAAQYRDQIMRTRHEFKRDQHMQPKTRTSNMGQVRAWEWLNKTKLQEGPTKVKTLEQEYKDGIWDANEEGDWEEARSLLEHMGEEGYKRPVTLYNKVLEAMVDEWETEEAQELFQAMKEEVRPDHETFHIMMKACEKDDEVQQDQLLCLDKEMQTIGLAPNQMTYNRLIPLLVKAGLTDEAKERFEFAQQMGLYQTWFLNGNILDMRDLPLEIKVLLTRWEVEKRAYFQGGRRKAGPGGFKILITDSERWNHPQVNVIKRVLRDEFGMEVNHNKKVPGRIEIKHQAMRRLNEEMQIARGTERWS